VLYGVETKALKRAVKRNLARFPGDFMFELTEEEFENLRYQSGASRWGGRRYRPYAFTEQGVAMLSSVLGSERAVRVNIEDWLRAVETCAVALEPPLERLIPRLFREHSSGPLFRPPYLQRGGAPQAGYPQRPLAA